MCLVRSRFVTRPIINQQSPIGNLYGGEGGIRTHGTVSRSQHFQCCQFNHSCTSPGIADCQLAIAAWQVPINEC